MRAYDIVKSQQDLRRLSWTQAAFTSGTGGMLLKSREQTGSTLWYYKLSSYDSYRGVYGHECVNELVASRLLDILGIEHVRYALVNALVSVDGDELPTWLCRSPSFRRTGERKVSLDTFFDLHRKGRESPLDLCRRYGWGEHIRQVALLDYLIANRDRHGANMEVLQSRNGVLRLAPLFDNGLSLCFSTYNGKQLQDVDPLQDIVSHNYLGSRSLEQNLIEFVPRELPIARLREANEQDVMHDLAPALDGAVAGVSGQEFADFLWRMIWERWCRYESLRDSGCLQEKG